MGKNKRILGLDLGVNSIGWALVEQSFDEKIGDIMGLGSRIIPMTQDVIDKFGSGQSISQTADRTGYRGGRRLYQRDNLRRDRLHRVLNILGFLPKHYVQNIDFEKHFGQFKNETKLNYKKSSEGKFQFIFMNSFHQMVNDFKQKGQHSKIPYDLTIYFLRKKALYEKISKEELAWVLLNFNQKRGYYELRGEEEELDEGKTKTFEVLKVTNVIDSGQTNKLGEKLYDIYFENGWKYDKQCLKPKIWMHKTKEYIVTAFTLKDGSIKRSYKEVDSEKDWIAIKEKTEKDIVDSGKHVGEYIYDSLLINPSQKIRGKLIKTIERRFYKKELQKILRTQIELQPELFSVSLYHKCIEELYPRNEAHRKNIINKGFEYLFLEDIIFYQRPLKSKKSIISCCQYESRTYFVDDKKNREKEKKIQGLKVIPKSHPLFIEFRMWQFLRNLKIYHKHHKNNVDITDYCFQDSDQWTDLFDYLMDKKEVEQKHIINYLVKRKKIEKNVKDEYRWNFQEEIKLPMNETKSQFISRFKKVKGFDLSLLTTDFQLKLWHIIYSVTDKKQFDRALATFANKHQIEKESFVLAFKSFPPYKSEYGAYSEKAIKKLLPLMRIGKYWNEDAFDENGKEEKNKIYDNVKSLISDIKTRLELIDYDNEVFEKDRHNLLRTIVDDDIPKQLLKSFISFKNKNYLEGLNTYQACYLVYHKYSEVSAITQWKTPADIDLFLNTFRQHSLRNPIVEQVLTETLRTVRDIWNFYGKGSVNFFDEIHLKLGRGVKNSKKKRGDVAVKNTVNKRRNDRINELLKELKLECDHVEVRPYSPSHQEILKIYEEGVYQNPDVKYDCVSEEDIIRIRKNNNLTRKDVKKYMEWLEQGYISPYTGLVISLRDLFTDRYQIEHIIPQSRYFDDSLGNKIICEAAVNYHKSNRTAYEYIKSEGGSVIDLGEGKTATLLKVDEYENHCSNYFKKNRIKLNNLLSVDVPEGYINQQMNDSRYISKMVKGVLSNIVRGIDEKEIISKKLLPVPEKVLNLFKKDWGLNDKWNELIAPRFKRLNELTNSMDYGFWDKNIDAFRTQVPDEIIKKGFNKKRIDHRIHPLDALVVSLITCNHTHYLHSLEFEKENVSLKDKLLVKNNKGYYTKSFQLPWSTFSIDAKNKLELIVISFKKNMRVINKTNNKTWQWVKQQNGAYKKELVRQTKGDNWAIRKPLHKETVSGQVRIKRIKKGLSNLNAYLLSPDLIVDKIIKKKIMNLNILYDNDLQSIKKHLDENPIQHDGEEISKIKVYEWTKGATATRVLLTDKFTRKQLESITDTGIQKILENHLKNYVDENGKEQFDKAFSVDGLNQLNKNIVELNGGKKHQPIYKVRIYEVGSKFPVSDQEGSSKSKKFVEAAKGTNLFFAVYWDNKKQKRNYETIPLDEVIQHQKNVAHLPKNKRTEILPKPEKGIFKFTLSPNDLVFVPNKDEQANPDMLDLSNLKKEQVDRIYKMVSTTQNKLEATPVHYASPIINNEIGSNNKSQNTIDGVQIKSVCWKLEVDRIGNITGIIK